MIKRIFLSFAIFFFTFSALAQAKMTSADYIEKYHKIAVRQMKEYKIPASIILAQGILESGNGNSELARNAKNHFGIKCHSTWTGKGYYMDDDAKDECFRVYKSPEESYKDHSLFLTKRGRYEFLFTDFNTTDYKKWAHGLKKAGYATNPKYPQLLIGIIEKNELYKYDRKNFKPEIVVEEEQEMLVLEEINDENFAIEQSDEYIKALMGRTVYYSDKEKGIFIFNRIKTIKAKNKTTLAIAMAYEVNYEQLLKYNDITAEDRFTAGQNVFLQPKRFNGSQKEYMVKPGDSMWEIAQMFGIKLSALYKKNLLETGTQVQPGEVLSLRKKRKVQPKILSYAALLKAKKANIIKPKVEAPKQETKAKDIVNINIYNNIEPAVKETKKNTSTELIPTKEAYPEKKYVDKNEEIIKIIDEIPIIDKAEQTKKTNFVSHKVEEGETLYFLSRKYGVSVEEIKKANNLLDNSIKIGQELIILQKE